MNEKTDSKKREKFAIKEQRYNQHENQTAKGEKKVDSKRENQTSQENHNKKI